MATQAPTTDASTLEPPSQSAVRLVPYAFARDAKLLVARQDVDTLEVWVCPETSRTALAELGRVFGALQLVTLSTARCPPPHKRPTTRKTAAQPRWWAKWKAKSISRV